MAAPDPRDPLRRYLKVQGVAEREVVSILNNALKDIESQLAALEGKSGVGVVIRRAQVQAAKTAILRRLVNSWAKIGNVIEVQSANAALVAAVANGKYDTAILQRMGITGTAAKDYQLGLEKSAQRAVQLAINRNFDQSGTTRRLLSARVYQSQALITRQVEAKIESALARGLSAREFSREVKSFISPSVPGGASYSAMRLARTEINNAFHYAQVLNVANKPWVSGMKWNLSRSHPKLDTCDSLASGSSPELDAGVYDVNSVPGKPHPQCLCFLTPVTLSPEKFEKLLLRGDFDAWQRQNIPSKA